MELKKNWKQINLMPDVVDNTRLGFVVVVGMLVLMMAIGSFYLSFSAVSSKAEDNAIVSGIIFALLIDGGIVIFSISRLYFSWYENRRVERLMLGLVLIFVIISIWMNLTIFEVSGYTFIHALPPILLFISFECFVFCIHDIAKAKEIGNSIVKYITALTTLENDFIDNQNIIESLQLEFDNLQLLIESKKQELKYFELNHNQKIIINFLMNNNLPKYNYKIISDSIEQLSYQQVIYTIKQLFENDILIDDKGIWSVVENNMLGVGD